jgi:mono/diheme cytochrome c family protein
MASIPALTRINAMGRGVSDKRTSSKPGGDCMMVIDVDSRRRAFRLACSMAAGIGMLAGLALSAGGAAAASAKGGADGVESGTKLVLPALDAAKGKRLFVERGCVVCHSVNKVGGRAGPPLDAPAGGRYVDLLDFMARMWRGAFAMIELQGMELGYQVDFSGEELGHIAAFLADSEMQKQFVERDVPDLIQDMFIREPYEMGEGLHAPGKR